LATIVGVISDTHDRVEVARRGVRLLRDLGANVIVHLGDFVAPFTLRAVLEEAGGARFYGVFGNNDGERVGLQLAARSAGATLAEQPLVVNVDGVSMLLLHGFGPPELTRDVVEALAASGKWGAVLYGHTHEARLERFESGTLLLNPGDGGGVLREPSVATIKVDGGRILGAEVHRL